MRKTHRRDANQFPLVRELLACGFSVADTSQVGGDFPDLVVARNALNVLVEVKTTNGRLTAGQNDFASRWRGPVILARSAEDVLAAFRHQLQAMK
jgi:Holliday junction resolvase